jgi:hypothetical protein
MRRREGERDNYIARDGGRERESKPEEVNEATMSKREREREGGGGGDGRAHRGPHIIVT